MKQKVYVLVQVTLEKPVADLVSHVASRVYTMDGVGDVHTVLVDGAVGETMMGFTDLKDDECNSKNS